MIGFITIAVLLFSSPQDEVTHLQWGGPPGTRPGTYREWIAAHPYKDFSFNLKRRVDSNGREGTVVIFSEEQIASSLSGEINQLMTNLQQEGYTVLSYEISGGLPDSLRSFLQTLYYTENIEGALFIGNLPIAWYQIEDDFNEYGYKEWPIDLFYMDLDGNWADDLKYQFGTLLPGQDSIYDGHTGNVSPEIYIGRLIPTGIGDDTLLIKNYLSKDNNYRHNSIALQKRAITYVDDDWYYWAPGWASDVSLLYDDILLISDSNTTRASDYRVRLDTVRAWVSLFAHSWPGGHQFYYNNHNSVDYYWSTEYTTQDPPANFYNHFACSFARYTDYGYGGGRSIFNQSYGVGEIGSTKTGSMLSFNYFYLPLSQEKTMGEAFRDWFAHIAQGGFSFNELCWHYGMTLLGDPFLKPSGHNLQPPICTLTAADACAPPNSTNNIIRIKLNNPVVIVEIEFVLKFDGSLITVNNVAPTTRTNFMAIEYTNWNDSLKVTMNGLISRDSLIPGEGPILDVLFDVNSGAVLGDSTPINLEDCVVKGIDSLHVDCMTVDGWLYFIPIPLLPTLISPDSGLILSDNTPLFRWTNEAYATNYWLQVDTDTFFSSLAVDDSTILPPLYILTSPLNDNPYYWRVCSGSRCGEWSDWSLPFNFTIDTRPPVIESTTIWHDTIYSGPFPIHTYVSDVNGVDSVILYYITDIDTNWTYFHMNQLDENHYSAEIPEQDSGYIRISYYILAYDVATYPNHSTDPINAPDNCYEFYIGILGASENYQPTDFFLGQNYPNPFIEKTTIPFSLPTDSKVQIEIYNVMGKKVKALVGKYFKAGCHNIDWYGIGESSERLPAGIYFYQISAGKYEAVKKGYIIR